jgi:hypothetical protein
MPIVLIVAGFVGGAVLLRAALREGRRINRELDEAREARINDPAGIRTLRRDPATGTYRPG